ncbi:putative sigma-54 specific transcriptional regulator [Escherichia coli]|uniref:Putative sigma-54 specific transcriptional regulator n=1 Tax=Escherichia coli TaxID=562 RepID=A0A376K7C5_ECOLX|nr:putative sigma-54 specific transcriptional regulator [Escherichia coli]
MSELIATAASSINAFTLAKRVAAFNVPVLIQGETGAGKECVAKYIHTVAFGENESAPYVGVNCAAIPGKYAGIYLIWLRQRCIYRRNCQRARKNGTGE